MSLTNEEGLYPNAIKSLSELYQVSIRTLSDLYPISIRTLSFKEGTPKELGVIFFPPYNPCGGKMMFFLKIS